MSGEVVELGAVTGQVVGDGGVEHGARLIAFTDAALGSDDGRLAREREALRAVITPEAFVDTCALILDVDPEGGVQVLLPVRRREGRHAGEADLVRRRARRLGAADAVARIAEGAGGRVRPSGARETATDEAVEALRMQRPALVVAHVLPAALDAGGRGTERGDEAHGRAHLAAVGGVVDRGRRRIDAAAAGHPAAAGGGRGRGARRGRGDGRHGRGGGHGRDGRARGGGRGRHLRHGRGRDGRAGGLRGGGAAGRRGDGRARRHGGGRRGGGGRGSVSHVARV